MRDTALRSQVTFLLSVRTGAVNKIKPAGNGAESEVLAAIRAGENPLESQNNEFSGQANVRSRPGYFERL